MSTIALHGDQNYHPVEFQSHCVISNDPVVDASGTTSWQSVDLHFTRLSKPSADYARGRDPRKIIISDGTTLKQEHDIHSHGFGSAAAFQFALDCLSEAATKDKDTCILRFVVPRTSGYIARSDILSQRMLDCSLVEKVVSFALPQQFFHGDLVGVENIPEVFAASIGGMLVTSRSTQQPEAPSTTNGMIGNGLNGDHNEVKLLSLLDLELQNRLSFPWLSPQAPPTKRPTLAIVDGGLRGPDDGGTGGSIYLAAQALGIDMVLFDSPEHWTSSPKYRHWRKDLVPLQLDMEPDAGFASRIADAVRSYEGQIDGILTFRDHYKLPVAQAAVQLGLPTYAPSAYDIATDKFKTSVCEGHIAHQASSAEEAVKIVQDHNLKFPLIIKPCNGFLSEGVFRIENLPQLEAGAGAINTDRHGKEFVIEKYCEGPEVDANLVLCDGEVIFFEASDDFPKGADVNGYGNVQNFIELANVLPSGLPPDEQILLRDSLRQSLLKMGFQDGFYHIEARVENSSMEYATKNKVLDIRKRDKVVLGAEPPSTWLIEVNPRPPGIQASEAARYTYGIDYFGLALLFALEDKQRVRQLSHAFTQGPQYWCEMVFIPVERGGVFESDDVCLELLSRRPDLINHVSAWFCFLKKGDRVADPLKSGVNSWVAYFNVYSRESREHLLELSDVVRREVTYSIV